MKNVFVIITLFLLFFCCKNSDNNQENKEIVEEKKEFVEAINDSNTKVPFYIINISAASTDTSASDIVIEKRKKFNKVNYLWIPDYESLSGKEMYAVFLGPFTDLGSAIFELLQYKTEDNNAYLIKVEHEEERFVMLDRFDVRINNIKQKLLFFYSNTDVLTEYYNTHEDDLAWYTLTEVYFRSNHSDSVYMPLYEDWLSEQEKVEILQKMGEDTKTMGYILIDNDKKFFIRYDDYNCEENICDFFGLQYNED